MAESLGTNFEIKGQDYERVDSLIRLLEKNRISDSFIDPVERALFAVLEPTLRDKGVLRPHMAETFATHRQIGSFFSVPYALRSLTFGIDRQMREMFGEEFPSYFVHDTTWNRRKVFSQLDYNVLYEDMMTNLQSNMHVTWGIYQAFSHAYSDRLGADSTVLNNGASLGVAETYWLLNDRPCRPIDVVKPPLPGQPVVSEAIETDEEFQEIVNYLFSLSPPVNRVVGYDTMSVSASDPEAVSRVFSHTFPLSESEWRPTEVEDFKRLVAIRRENDEELRRKLMASPNEAERRQLLLESKVVAVRGFVDATEPYMLTKLTDYLPVRGADMGIYSAVLFEHSLSDAEDILANTGEYYSAYAPRLYFEPAEEDPNSPIGIRMKKNDWWHQEGTWGLFENDPLAGSQVRELARFSNRRAEEMWLTPRGREVLRKAVQAV